jgi:hypothetical protein
MVQCLHSKTFACHLSYTPWLPVLLSAQPYWKTLPRFVQEFTWGHASTAEQILKDHTSSLQELYKILWRILLESDQILKHILWRSCHYLVQFFRSTKAPGANKLGVFQESCMALSDPCQIHASVFQDNTPDPCRILAGNMQVQSCMFLLNSWQILTRFM